MRALSARRSVDGHPLPIDQLKGTTPTESIDFSGKKLGVVSFIIIAACIGGNEHLKQLKCAACGRAIGPAISPPYFTSTFARAVFPATSWWS